MKEKGRTVITIGTFDLIKGIGMISIVIGHMLSDYNVERMPVLMVLQFLLQIAGYGLMPMFYIVSGFGSKEKATGSVLKKSAKELLLPYAWVTAVIAVLFPVCHYLTFRWWPGAFSETARYVLAFLFGVPCPGKTLFGISLYECSVVWFLLSLFIAMNVMNAILKLRKEWQRTAVVFLCVLAGYGCSLSGIWYYCIPQGLMAVGYFYLGYRIKKGKWLQKALPAWQLAVLLTVSVLEIIFGGFYFSYNSFRWGLLDYVGAGCVGLLLLRAGIWTNNLEDGIWEAIRKVGRYTYWAMCVHAVEMTCIPWYLFAERFEKYPQAAFVAEGILRGIIIGLGCLVLERISGIRRRKRLEKRNAEKRVA